jgi:hypothetical protein
MDTEHTHGLMEKNMKENFKTLKYMEEGNMNGQMGECKYYIILYHIIIILFRYEG